MVKRLNTLIGTGAAVLLTAALPAASAYVPMMQTTTRVRTPFSSASSSSSSRTSLAPLHAGVVYEETSISSNPQVRPRVDRTGNGTGSAAAKYNKEETSLNLSFLESSVLPVLSASLLITGNTVGAGSLVLAKVAEGPGLAVTAGIFAAAFGVNLISGLVLAEVAIKQKEASGGDVSASFKEFAEATLESPVAANAISGVSIFVNSCILAFDLSRAGTVGSDLVDGLFGPNALTLGLAAVMVGLLTTQSTGKLSNIASACVGVLFLSFGGLLIPGLAAVQDPMAVLTAPGLSPDLMGSIGHAAPVILMSLVYQNIVPTIVKMLDYDRAKSVASITLGSLIPLLMYLAWSYACLGGGIDQSVGMGGGLMAIFSLSTLAGSSLASTMSLAEEVNTFVPPETKEVPATAAAETTNNNLQLPTVLATVAIPLAVALACAGGDQINEALSLAGSFGSPLLYGAIPAVMAIKQREQSKNDNANKNSNLVPGFSLGLLGLASTGFMGEELMQRLGEVGDLMSFAS